MINYVIDYLENSGIVFTRSSELESVTIGIRQYLLENGIPEKDKREYFKKYINRSLSRIDKNDLKQFFICYPTISSVNQICIEFSTAGTLPCSRKNDLLNHMSLLYSSGLGDKYVPAVEIKGILGKLA